MRDVIEEKYNMDRDYIEIEDWELELEEVIGNGLYWYVGYANSANLTALGEGSGTAKGDGSKYTLTFVAEEPELMYKVNSSIISTLLLS